MEQVQRQDASKFTAIGADVQTLETKLTNDLTQLNVDTGKRIVDVVARTVALYKQLETLPGRIEAIEAAPQLSPAMVHQLKDLHQIQDDVGSLRVLVEQNTTATASISRHVKKIPDLEARLNSLRPKPQDTSVKSAQQLEKELGQLQSAVWHLQAKPHEFEHLKAKFQTALEKTARTADDKYRERMHPQHGVSSLSMSSAPCCSTSCKMLLTGHSIFLHRLPRIHRCKSDSLNPQPCPAAAVQAISRCRSRSSNTPSRSPATLPDKATSKGSRQRRA